MSRKIFLVLIVLLFLFLPIGLHLYTADGRFYVFYIPEAIAFFVIAMITDDAL